MRIVSPKLIAFLAGAALIGLCVIQYYWISGAVEQRREHFEQDVREAMMNVTRRYARAEARERMRNQLSVPRLPQGFNSRQNYSLDTGANDTSKISISRQKLQRGLDALSQRSDLMQRPVGELFSLYNQMIQMNIFGETELDPDTALVDSLLRYEFKNRGINTRYVWTVFSAGSMPLFGNGDDPQQSLRDSLLTSRHRVSLRPDNIFSQPHMLAVYFPFQNGYILKSLWLMLVLSVLFVLFILLLFYYSISTIYRQKQFSEIKNDFISNMTHELKTPISTISLACEVLADSSVEKTQDRLNRYVSMIKEENKRLGGLVENVLQSALLDKGNFRLKTEPVDFHALLRNAVNSVRIQVENKSGEITMSLDAKRFDIECDRTHTQNLIFNLLDNAIKYTPGQPLIRVSTVNTATGIQLCVEDNGIGISRENQKKIFDKLYRVPTGNVHDVKGFGLGLSYVKAIALKHGGDVFVQSEPGHGSQFYVNLPFYAPATTNE
jgi:two-component system, OmpR family, phosphate regulon sensor histidine kinase PhoR